MTSSLEKHSFFNIGRIWKRESLLFGFKNLTQLFVWCLWGHFVIWCCAGSWDTQEGTEQLEGWGRAGASRGHAAMTELQLRRVTPEQVNCRVRLTTFHGGNTAWALGRSAGDGLMESGVCPGGRNDMCVDWGVRKGKSRANICLFDGKGMPSGVLR